MFLKRENKMDIKNNVIFETYDDYIWSKSAPFMSDFRKIVPYQFFEKFVIWDRSWQLLLHKEFKNKLRVSEKKNDSPQSTVKLF